MSLPRYAVLGHPIAHSLSPQIHRAFAEQLEIALEYTKIDVAPADFDRFWREGDGQRLAGANVTLPLKQLAYELVNELSDDAAEAGSVNTIVRRDGNLLGCNTDGVGLLADLTQNLTLPIAGQRLLLLGAGGAARGVLGPLLRDAPGEVVIANRTLRNARALLEQFRGRVPMCISALDELAEAGTFDGIINATSLGFSAARIELPNALLTPTSWCYDLSYGAAAEPFLTWAQAAECQQAHDGLGMLVEQAAASFSHWHKVSPCTDAIIRQLREIATG